MAKFDLIGGSYASTSLNADAQVTRNWYPERIESGQGKSPMALYPSPGLKKFAAIAGFGLGGFGRGGFGTGEIAKSISSMLYLPSAARLFAVAEYPAQQYLIEVFVDGKILSRGGMGVPGTRASLAYNNANQLLVASGGRVFLMNLTTNALTEVDTTSLTKLQGAVSQISYTDGYFIALVRKSNKFEISALLDGASWNPLDITGISVFPDFVDSIIVDHREIVVMGPKQSIVYTDSGNANFPFDVVPGGFVEQGVLAPDSLTKLDNSLFWIGGDERGGAMAWRAVGYRPERISNHAIESEWQGYATASDAKAYSFQDKGHTFWHVYFPTANKSWRYDVATSMWHEVSSGGGAHKSQCHAMAYGKHLVGSPFEGVIYEMSTKYIDDDGAAIIRTRRCPHIFYENERVAHHHLMIDAEMGLGLPPLLDGQGHQRDPQLFLSWSDDGGHQYGTPRTLNMGRPGARKKRAIAWRLGSSRDRVYEISTNDPLAIVDGYLEASPGFQPTERLGKQMAKVS